MKTLLLKSSISKSRGSYGFNRKVGTCEGKKYVTIGGGYDMVSVVVGEWVTDELQEEIKSLKAHYVTDGGRLSFDNSPDAFGVLHRNLTTGEMLIDGAHGMGSVRRIVSACGYELIAIERLDKNGFYVETLGYNLIKNA